MSRYLVERIAGLPNVEVTTNAKVTGVTGADGVIGALRWTVAGQETERAIHHLFLFIGADPNTDWLAGSGVALDDKGFVVTEDGSLETSLSGVFAIGDVRAASVKRVAAAVGEGAQVVAALHKFLATPAPATV
jgi:thioredoxin reductase (NADPH)